MSDQSDVESWFRAHAQPRPDIVEPEPLTLEQRVELLEKQVKELAARPQFDWRFLSDR